jgi:hypothetical protein
MFLLSTESRMILEPNFPSSEHRGFFASMVKRPGHEADHFPSSSADIMNAWSYAPSPTYVFIALSLINYA